MSHGEKVRFRNADGSILTGIFEPASDGAGCVSRRVIILLHGMYQHKNINMLRPYGARMAADPDLSLATFRFDCRGLGESEGVTSFTPHYSSLADLEAAVDYLEHERKMTVHCIFGYSAGGNVSVMYASKHPGRIPFITVHSSRFTMSGIRKTLTPPQTLALAKTGAFEYTFSRRGVDQVLVVDEATVQLCADIDMGAQCRRVPATTHVLCTHGLADARVPACDSAGYVSNLANVTQHLFPEAGHDYKEDGVHDELYAVFKAWILGGAVRAQESRRVAFAHL